MTPQISYDNGIQIEGLEFYLDATRTCDFSFISHAHSDHARKHKRIIATPETVLLYQNRYPDVKARAIPYGRPTKIGAATIEFFPSGHMLGAAQILIEYKGIRIIYTGDFKVYSNLTCPPLETRRCDVLIMESTYGDPAYSFPPQNQVYTQILSFIRRAVDEKYLPVLVGYAMGKAQEAVVFLQQQGFVVCVDTAVSQMNQLYRAGGVKLKPTEHYLHSSLEGKVLVVAPQTLRKEEFREIRRRRSLFLSGWSVGNRRFGFGTDLGLPLSDHADFSQLLAYIKECDPRKIYTMHGEPKFAQLLREMGHDAEYFFKGFCSSTTLGKRTGPRESQAVLGENFELFG